MAKLVYSLLLYVILQSFMKTQGFSTIPGGKAPVRDATEEVKEIALAVKAEVEAKVNQTFAVYEAVKYRSQVVAGVNYYIKVHVGDDKYIHITVWSKLDQTLELTSVEMNKTADDDL